MPIHDQSYRRYGGARRPPGRAWAVIAKAGVQTLLAKRAFVALLLLAWLPFFVRVVQMYAAANLPQVAFLAPTPQTFRRFLAQQNVFVFFVTVYAGAGLIANDRRANALQIYLSRPLSRLEYVFGKLGVLMPLLLLITWVPAILLLVVQFVFAGNVTFVRANLFLFPAITVYTFIEALVACTSMLALSSLSRSSRYVGVLYAALILFGQALSGVLQAATGDRRWAFISMIDNLFQIGDRIFQMPVRSAAPWPVPLVMVAALVVVCGLILERRVRGVEVVG